MWQQRSLPLADHLSPIRHLRVDLAAQAVYLRTEQVLPWANIAQATRAEFRHRALAAMRLDGSLAIGADFSDDGYAELLVLDREADGVIHGVRRRE
jgi:hypothetical protein